LQYNVLGRVLNAPPASCVQIYCGDIIVQDPPPRGPEYVGGLQFWALGVPLFNLHSTFTVADEESVIQFILIWSNAVEKEKDVNLGTPGAIVVEVVVDVVVVVGGVVVVVVEVVVVVVVVGVVLYIA